MQTNAEQARKRPSAIVIGVGPEQGLGAAVARRFALFKISRDAIRSIAHGRVAHRIARQKGAQQLSRLAVGVPGAQLGL